jgi:nucleoside 2-deoxyribosyltransferase
MRKIYWAAPLFTAAEREWNVKCARFLEFIGHKVHLPQENEPRNKTADAIFIEDVHGIDWADTIIAVMDGADPDSGTCWEVGYGYALGKYIIQIRTDFRNSDDPKLAPYNLMLHESAHKVFTSLEQLYKWLEKEK